MGNSRRRNSFGTTISNEPKRRNNKREKSKRLPLYPSGDSSVCSADTSSFNNAESEENDMNILNTMEKRKERIFANMNNRKNNRSFNDVVVVVDDQEEEDEDDESSFNP